MNLLIPADSSLTVRQIVPDETADWDAFVHSHPDGTIYHTTAWARAMEETIGHVPVFLEARNPEGNLVGVLPLYRVGGVLGRRIVSVPFRDRGGVIACGSAPFSVLLRKAREIAESDRCSYMELRALREIEASVLPPDMIMRKHWINTVVRLLGDAAAQWKLLKNNAQGPVKQAQKAGVTVRWGDEGDLQAFCKLFVHTRRKLGVPSYPLSFFSGLWRYLPKGAMRLLLAEHTGRPTAGLILFASGNRVIEGYAASWHPDRHLRANDFLVWSAIEWSCAEGFRFYDFGADSPEQTGLLAFKHKWSGELEPVYNYYLLFRTKRVPLVDSSHRRYWLARSAWRLLPAAAYDRLSYLAVRHLS